VVSRRTAGGSALAFKFVIRNRAPARPLPTVGDRTARKLGMQRYFRSLPQNDSEDYRKHSDQREDCERAAHGGVLRTLSVTEIGDVPLQDNDTVGKAPAI